MSGVLPCKCCGDGEDGWGVSEKGSHGRGEGTSQGTLIGIWDIW